MEIKSKAADAEVTSTFWTTGPGRGNPGGASELDMFEMFGGHKTNEAWKKRLKFNIISWDPTNQINIEQKKKGKIGTTHTRMIQADHNTADDFHVYGFEWTEDKAVWSVDGVVKRELLRVDLSSNKAQKWPDEEMYIVLNNEVQTNATDKTTQWPNYLKIDYVEIYQK